MICTSQSRLTCVFKGSVVAKCLHNRPHGVCEHEDVVQRDACGTLPWPKTISHQLDIVSCLSKTFEHSALPLLKPFARKLLTPHSHVWVRATENYKLPVGRAIGNRMWEMDLCRAQPRKG